jgi:hypothetical protein
VTEAVGVGIAVVAAAVTVVDAGAVEAEIADSLSRQ